MAEVLLLEHQVAERVVHVGASIAGHAVDEGQEPLGSPVLANALIREVQVVIHYSN